MIGVLFATEAESQPLIAELSRIADKHEVHDIASVYSVQGVAVGVIVIGMGKPLARQGTLRFIERFAPTRLINAGIAGALSDALEINRAYRVVSSVEWPSLPEVPVEWSDRGFKDLPHARLVTVGEPVFDNRLRGTLASLGDMVDMEGAAVVAIARASRIECVGIKCISDFAKDGHRETLHTNLHHASETLAKTITERLVP